ncbi:hypothetical protein N7474_004979 [Penicillium riverlandense]|uniref:uncharacterized protein n=1 Tax=Penicillium riverlandense TaxID=1903569 RepID=UPI0025498624|nr:uncharacterized protein N7474_004979 [Penicillium riverlandense]KAJ5819388.1 hypothetical protein N7474_004979 [Penicillium riverlandense]
MSNTHDIPFIVTVSKEPNNFTFITRDKSEVHLSLAEFTSTVVVSSLPFNIGYLRYKIAVHTGLAVNLPGMSDSFQPFTSDYPYSPQLSTDPAEFTCDLSIPELRKILPLSTLSTRSPSSLIRETVSSGANVATASDPYLITEIIGEIQLLIQLSASAHGREPNVWR